MNARKIFSFLAVALLGAAFFSPQYRAFAELPAHLSVPSGGVVRLDPAAAFFGLDQSGGVRVQGRRAISALSDGRLSLRLAGLPLKQVRVERVPRVVVALGGQAVAVRLQGSGPTVVALERVPTLDGALRAPGIAAGLHVGDLLLRVDGRKVGNDLPQLIDRAGRAGRTLTLEVRREGRRRTLRAQAAFDREIARYRLGIYVRDQLSGIGTLTFADVARGRFAALGHRVQMAALGEAPQVGSVLPAAIIGLQPARIGRPGQKLGVVDESGGLLGEVQRNTEVGIGGRLRQGPAGPRLPVASVDQVHTGGATLYTVLSGNRVRRFAVRIERTIRDPRAGSKSLVLHIVDRGLLRRTGGIVQGMSGSPIVQDGLLVGAVTHVFIHDPTRGYGTYAAWMLEQLCGRSLRHGSSARPAPSLPAETGQTAVFARSEEPCGTCPQGARPPEDDDSGRPSREPGRTVLAELEEVRAGGGGASSNVNWRTKEEEIIA